MSATTHVANWPGRAYGTFVTAAGGNYSGPSAVACGKLKNGLCVGWFQYNTYNDLTSHRRAEVSGIGSSYINDPFDSSLERPHVLGPGTHMNIYSGLHMPNIHVDPISNQMRYAAALGGVEIWGSSFAAPALLSAAIQAHQYEGWFSALAYPMVNKAVLMASTQDSNADGAIGNSTSWSSQATDAEDGAGQVNMAFVKQVLDGNQYTWNDVGDPSFVSCGTNCRKYAAASITVPANARARVALAWHSCMIAEGDVPALNNDLDLVLNCGNPFDVCGGSHASTAVSSELELLERPAVCPTAKSCTIEVRIKNGATLSGCGTTSTERIGVAWSYAY